MIAENPLAPVAHRILWLPGEDRHWDHDSGFGGRRNVSGVRVDPDTALQSTVVLACARVLAESVAGLPLHLYRRVGDGGKTIAREHPLYRILHDQPNGWQTSFEWREQQMLHLCLHGNAYSEIRSGSAGSVSELVPLHPSRMRVERVEGGRLRYKYREEGGRETVYSQDSIMHLRWLSDDGVNGMVPVDLARDAIGLARACEIHGASFFGNGARPGVILTTEQTIPSDAAETLRNNWERMHRGPDKAQRTAVLTGGLKPIELGGNNQEAQFLEARRFQVEEICRLYRVPPHLVGDLTRSSFSNIEQQSIDFVQHTLLGWLRRFESAFTRDLIVDDANYFVEFDTRGLLRGDAAARASYYNTMHQLGVLSLNEIRAAENLNPVDGGEIRVVPLNMQTLEQANAASRLAMAPEVEPVAEEVVVEEPAVPADAPTVLGVLDQYRQGAVTIEAAKALLQVAFPQTPEVMIDTILAGVVVKEPEPVPEIEPEPAPIAPEENRAAPGSVAEGDFVSWGSAGGRERGRIVHVMDYGTLDIPGTDFTIDATEEDPAALIAVYEEVAGGWRPTDTQVGHKVSTLTKIDPLSEPPAEENAYGKPKRKPRKRKADDGGEV
jgi:HK97 family phage portal protein